MAEVKEYSFEEVACHNTEEDVMIVIGDTVYNCTSFLNEHPGGDYIIMEFAGQDATEAFEDTRHSDDARKILPRLRVGKLKSNP